MLISMMTINDVAEAAAGRRVLGHVATAIPLIACLAGS
jgi:hypothetical protein